MTGAFLPHVHTLVCITLGALAGGLSAAVVILLMQEMRPNVKG